MICSGTCHAPLVFFGLRLCCPVTLWPKTKKNTEKKPSNHFFPISERVKEVSEQANESAVQANEGTDEQVAQYCSLMVALAHSVL